MLKFINDSIPVCAKSSMLPDWVELHGDANLKPQIAVEVSKRRLEDNDFVTSLTQVLFGGDTMNFQAKAKIEISGFNGDEEEVFLCVNSCKRSMRIGDEFEGIVGVKVRLKRIR